jgi:hypothetical protein
MAAMRLQLELMAMAATAATVETQPLRAMEVMVATAVLFL